MCSCVGIESFGGYENQTEIISPWWSSHQTICIDTCLADEIKMLWTKGIKTTGCCCGHNIGCSMINVSPESIKGMEDLGYEHTDFPNFKKSSWYTFKPRSIKALGETKKHKNLMEKS